MSATCRTLAYVFLGTLACMGQASARDWPEFKDTHLAFGRTIWLETCRGCHGDGVAGAPVPSDTKNWQKRIAKGKETLYQHALEGFFGPDDTMMPARGGNEKLTDKEVKAAVDYMLAVVEKEK